MKSPRLTKYLRDAFVRAAIDDVPKVDYNEQAQKLANAHLDALLKKAFGFEKPSDEQKKFLSSLNFFLPGTLTNMYRTGPNDYYIFQKDLALWARLEDLSAKNKVQIDTIKALSEKLSGAALSCNTVKQLADLLPEFAKYLPQEPEVCKTLPAVNDLMADFVKAGWPKDNPQKTKAKK